MQHPRTRTRRLAVAALLVGAIGVAAALSLSAHSASARSSSGSTVSYYHQGKLLGSAIVAAGGSLDVVWKGTTCSNGYGSPPTAFTWNGTATGAPGGPVMGPCSRGPGNSKVKGPDDLACTFPVNPPYINCYWTYKSSAGPSYSFVLIRNPGRANGGLAARLYLYKRTVLYAYLVTPGKPKQRITVPAGTDAVQFASAP